MESRTGKGSICIRGTTGKPMGVSQCFIRYRQTKNVSLPKQKKKRVFYERRAKALATCVCKQVIRRGPCRSLTHGVVVVRPKNPAVLLSNRLMGARPGNEGRVHVNVVAAEVEGDQELKEEGVFWIGRGEEAQQARCCAPGNTTFAVRERDQSGTLRTRCWRRFIRSHRGRSAGLPVCDHIKHTAEF